MSSPDLTESEREAVAEVLRSRWLSMGSQVQAFEAALAEYVGTRFAVAVSSGTAALHLCVRAAGIDEGNLVITTPFSFVASANVMLYERATPIFVDVDQATGNLDVEQVAAAAADLNAGKQKWLPRQSASGGPLRGILAVDVFGQPADYGPLESIAEQYGLSLIEDASEALGAEYQDRPAGSFGDGAALAFYPNKQLTTGEGGMVLTDRQDWAERIAALRNQGRAAGDAWLAHTFPGYNYRLDEMSAGLGHAQAQRIDELLANRAQVAAWYQTELGEVDGLDTPQVATSTSKMSWFVYVVQLAVEVDRASIMAELAEQEIPSRTYFEPIHLQPYMVERYGYRQGDFPIAEDLGRRSLALPFSGVMTQEQVGVVSEAVKRAIANQ
jgi:dTDP-4-amino-4,6-dideoxygalactose transaminase